ncbi:MAG: methionyl-tRNA formyltransferase, partial [Gammaproteobacteria bacterium]|nr:methionyl-tRNA formyltransferase [Gammaproteobacteria bacterium]
MTGAPISRVAFAGTPDFAVPALSALLDDARFEVVAVLTQPDRRAGRGRRVQPGPVKALALARGAAVLQPDDPGDDATLAALSELRPDLIVVAAYGRLLSERFLGIARCGTINVHASLLPRWRGAAPIERAIIEGDEETGISIMRVVRRLDAGPVILKRRCPVGAHVTGGELRAQLAELGAVALLAALEAAPDGSWQETPQTESEATYAAKITGADTQLDWQEPAVLLARKIRAFSPEPGMRAALGQLEVKIRRADAQPLAGKHAPGTIVSVSRDGIDVATGDG